MGVKILPHIILQNGNLEGKKLFEQLGLVWDEYSGMWELKDKRKKAAHTKSYRSCRLHPRRYRTLQGILNIARWIRNDLGCDLCCLSIGSIYSLVEYWFKINGRNVSRNKVSIYTKALVILIACTTY